MVVSVGIDLKLFSQRRAVGRIALALDAVCGRVRAARPPAFPHRHEATAGQGRHRGPRLVVGSVGVDLKLAADRDGALAVDHRYAEQNQNGGVKCLFYRCHG